MSRSLLVLSFLATLAISSYSQTRTWEKLKGPYGAKIECLRVHNNGSYYVTAVVDDGRRLLKSTDQGKTWTKLPQLPKGLDTSSLNLSPLYFSYLYSIELGTDSMIYLLCRYPNQQSSEYPVGAIYTSTNDGQVWKMIRDSVLNIHLTGKPGESIITVPDSVYYTGKRMNNDGVFIDSSSLQFSECYWISDSTYVRLDQTIPFISTDYCKTWTRYTDAPWGNAGRIEYMTRGRDNFFYINCRDSLQVRRIYKGNFTTGWKKLGDPPANLGRMSLLSNDRIVGFELYPQIYSPFYILKTDWPVMTKVSSLPIPLDYHTLNMLTTDPLDGIIFPTSEAIFRSSDVGVTWEEFPFPYSVANLIHVNDAGHIFAKRGSLSTLIGEQVNSYVSKSTDGGETWTKTSPVFRAPYGYIGPGFDGGTILTVSDTAKEAMDIWNIGNDNSSEWTKLARTIDPSKDSTVTPGYRIPRYTLADSAGNVFVADKALFKSEDKGLTWNSNITQPPSGVSVACFSPTWKLYAASGRKISMSADLGKTWNGLYVNKAFMYGSIVSMCAPGDSTLFAGNNEEGMSVSFNGGKSWKKVNGPWGDTITCVAYTLNNEVFIGTKSRGLFSCDHTGQNAKREPLEIPYNRVLSLYVDKGKDVYVGTQGAGLWKSEGTIPTSVHNKVRSDGYQAEIVHSTNGNISLRLTLNIPMTFDITLYDALGKELRTLKEKTFSNGTYIVPFDVSSLASGTYFIRLRDDKSEQVLKFIR
jgi:photosystem II stability/assembly factor-like uncharacterized protein